MVGWNERARRVRVEEDGENEGGREGERVWKEREREKRERRPVEGGIFWGKWRIGDETEHLVIKKL